MQAHVHAHLVLRLEHILQVATNPPACTTGRADIHECIGFPLPLRPWKNRNSSIAKENEAVVLWHSKSNFRACTHMTPSAEVVQTLLGRTADSCRLKATWSKPPLQVEPVRRADPDPDQLGQPSLDSLQNDSVFHIPAILHQDTVLQVQFHKCSIEWKNHLTC